jgi:putative addiction module component (TIGR02574 family)
MINTMKGQLEDITEAALALPPEARAALAGRLFESLEEADADADAAWALEIAERIDDLETGRVVAMPWSEARGKIIE